MRPQNPWFLASLSAVLLLALGVWILSPDAATLWLLLRGYADTQYLRARLQELGPLGPVVFIAIQALQVVIAPIPGEVTGFLGGYVFGKWLGFVYSTTGLTIGSLLAFGIGRWLGAAVVQRMVHAEIWRRFGFLVEAEGAVLCFVIFLIPGFPKDVVCFFLGLSPLPLWVFALTSTLGRIPGTWVLSAQGAQTAAGQYIELALVSALAAAIAIPLYFWRQRLLGWIRGRTGGETPAADPSEHP